MPGGVTELLLLLLLLLAPGVDHDVLGDLGVAAVCGDVQSGPAIPVAQVGVGPAPHHQPHDVEVTTQRGHLDGRVPVLVEEVDINLIAVAAEDVLQLSVITISESFIKP